MLKGIYSAAAGMTSELLMNDLIAENLANVSTPGFKAEMASFRSFGNVLVNQIEKTSIKPLGVVSQGSQLFQTTTQYKSGALLQTGNPLDVAINGDGFFAVKGEEDSIYYTRAGNFTKDAEGFIVTASGERVQGDGGDITIPADVTKIQVAKSGEVFGDGRSLGRIKVVQFEDNTVLKRAGSNEFMTDETPQPVANPSVEQGFIEQSNANVVNELVNSISALRAYETMQKTIQMQNQTLEKAINEVGRSG